jgi:hypothetical protein
VCNNPISVKIGHSVLHLRGTDIYIIIIIIIIISGTAAQRGLWPSRSRGFLITQNDAPQDSSGWVISSLQRPLPDNTKHTQQTNIQATDGIRTHDRSRRAAVDLRIRQRCHWDRRYLNLNFWKLLASEDIHGVRYVVIISCRSYANISARKQFLQRFINWLTLSTAKEAIWCFHIWSGKFLFIWGILLVGCVSRVAQSV